MQGGISPKDKIDYRDRFVRDIGDVTAELLHTFVTEFIGDPAQMPIWFSTREADVFCQVI